MISDARAVSRPLPADTGALPTIGRYRIVAEKGSGTFGTVYFGEDQATGRPVAIRILPRDLSDAVDAADIVRRRARAVLELSQNHPSLISVSEYGITADGCLFAIMERGDGQPLSEKLAHGTTADTAAMLRLGIELGAPVEALHNAGLVHGALRPHNYLVREDGHITLLDVELAALGDGPARNQRVLENSPAACSAPEQIEGQAVSEKTDVYAFATMLHQMIAGELPADAAEAHANQSWLAKPWALVRGQARVPAAITAALAEARDPLPQRRPFMQTLLNTLADRTLHRRPRNGRTIVVAGVLLIAAVGALVLLKAQRDRAAVPTVQGRPAETGTAPVQPPSHPVPPSTMPPASAPQPSAAPASVAAHPPIVPAPQRDADHSRSQLKAVTPPSPRPVRSPQAPAVESDEPDPGALIDFLLERRGER